MNNKNTSRGFRLIITVSLAVFLFAIIAGLIQRWVMPVERHLSSYEYEKMVFVENETGFYSSPERTGEPAGMFEEGSILYVVKSEGGFEQVRPFLISEVDSVWADSGETVSYTEGAYKEWLYDQEQKKFGFDE